MVHTNTTIEFDNQNIISICGYNESGKSTIVRALEVLLYNAHATDQASWIRDGEEYFKLVLTFNDGVIYERYKYYTGASWYRLLKDNSVIYDNKRGSQFINTDGMPSVIADYLGVISDENTKETLNIRRCTDKLFLVATTGGENYKLLNTILQSDRLLGASISLNEDKNKLQTQIITKSNQLSILKTTRDNTKVVGTEVINDFEQQLSNFEQQVQKFNSITGIRGTEQYIGTIVINKEVPNIDTTRLANIINIITTNKKAEQSIPKSVPEIQTQRYTTIKRLRGVKQESERQVPLNIQHIDTTRLATLQEMVEDKRGTEIKVPKKVDCIDTSKYVALNNLVTLLKHHNDTEQGYQTVNNEFEQVERELGSYVKQYNLTVCERCGAVTHSGHNHKD